MVIRPDLQQQPHGHELQLPYLWNTPFLSHWEVDEDLPWASTPDTRPAEHLDGFRAGEAVRVRPGGP
jgi:hypothetical protein